VERVDAVIAGVNKAGTTSLFVSLSEHPDVVASAVKETRYFLPARYGEDLEPEAVWERYFAAHPGRPVRLEATPSYFYGGAAVARAFTKVLDQPRVLLVLREPVARAVSFFEYQKVRLRFPPELTMEAYLAQADALGDTVGRDPGTERFMAVAGGRYADWLPEWWEVLGHDAVRIVWFEDLVGDRGAAVVRDVATWLGLDADRLPAAGLRSENRTTAYRHARLQRFALWANDAAERWLRKVPGFKRWLRALYFRLNGRTASAPDVAEATRAELARRFEEPNARLTALLDDAGITRPHWLR
jgi:hypothetical protein